MNAFGYSLIGFLIAIAILVAVHEYGHFWVARKLGVKVLRFSIGFGKPLFNWRRKDDPTEYSVGMIPLGGYVKMLDEREGDVAENERHMAFNRQSLPVRSAVVVAGPLYNFLFAIFAIWLVFIIGSDDIAPVVGEVVAESTAEEAGFLPGDRLLSIDDREVSTWGEHQFYLMHQAMKGNRVDFAVQGEDGLDRSLQIDFSTLDQYGIGGQPITSQMGLWPPPPPAEVSRVVADSPAEAAGLQPGDRILAIDGKPIANWIEMVEEVSTRPSQPMKLRVGRGDSEMDMDLVTGSVTVEGQEYGQIGLYRPQLENTRLRYGLLSAIPASLDYNWRMTVVTLRSLGRMLTAKMSSENLSGPITIARIAGDTVKSGTTDFLRFLAIISISLGLLNLLPIPVLDGGHLMFFLVEAIKGSPPSERMLIWAQQLGIVMLVLLMSVAFYNDIMRLFQAG